MAHTTISLSERLLIPGQSYGELMEGYKEIGGEYYEKCCLEKAPNRHIIGVKEVINLCNDNKNVRILDAGAGTGLVGQGLYENGFHKLDALEPSDDMAAVAVKKGIYKTIIKDFLSTHRLDISDNTYDVVVSVGLFAESHAKEDCFEELMRITKPGGYIITVTAEDYIVNSDYLKNFEPKAEQLQHEGKWKINKSIVPNYAPTVGGISKGIVYTMKVL